MEDCLWDSVRERAEMVECGCFLYCTKSKYYYKKKQGYFPEKCKKENKIDAVSECSFDSKRLIVACKTNSISFL